MTSSAVVGSSAMITSGSHDSAMAITARCRIPPLNSWGYRSINCGSSPTMRNRRATRSLASANVDSMPWASIALDHLLPDPVHRVQGIHRRLEHHRNAPPAIAPHLLFRQLQQIRSTEPDLASGQPCVFRQQAHETVGHRCLAAARLAHQSQRLPPCQLEADALHRLHLALPGLVAQREVDYFQDRCVG